MTPRATRWPLRAATGILAAALLLAACGGSGDDAPAAPPAPSVAQADRTEQADQADEAPQAPQPQATGPGPDLRVPGLAVYTKGVDLWLQRGATAELLLAGSQRISLSSPALSPDGSRVAYVRFDQAPAAAGDIGSDIHILDLGAGIDVPVRTHGRSGEFFWSPQWLDDGRLVYSHQVNEATGDGAAYRIAIELIDLNSGSVEVLRADATDPGLSPDAAMLAFVDHPASDHILAVAGLATGGQSPGLARVLLDTSDNLAFFRLPRFSPDGAWIAFLASGDGPLVASRPEAFLVAPLGALPLATAGNGVQDLWRIRPDGSGLTRLTTVLEDTPDYTWSSDGRHILLRGGFGVYLVEVETRVTQTLGPGEFHGTHDWVGVARDPS